MPHLAARALVDEEPRFVPPFRRPLGDQLRRELVLQRRGVHPGPTLQSPRGLRGRRAGSRAAGSSRRGSHAAGRRRRRARPGAGADVRARGARRAARVVAPAADRRGGRGRVPRAGAAGRTPTRRGSRARRPDDPPPRAHRDGHARRAPRARRRPRAARRPDLVRLEGRRRAALDGSRPPSSRRTARSSTASKTPRNAAPAKEGLAKRPAEPQRRPPSPPRPTPGSQPT